MKSYLLTTAVIFVLVALAHVLRIVSGETHLAADPWFILTTLASVGLSVWAVLLLRAVRPRQP